jgi:hypothetical protein
MAKDDERRKNFWDEEDSDEKTGVGIRRGESGIIDAGKDSADIDRKIHEARVLMEQTHQLYSHYFNGIEKRVPIEKVKLLETKIADLQRTGTHLTTAKFKINQFLIQYSSMKEMWDRKLRDREKK